MTDTTELEEAQINSMILLYFQKKEIYEQYLRKKKSNKDYFMNYYLTNKEWFDDYKVQLNFNENNFNSDNSYLNAKEKIQKIDSEKINIKPCKIIRDNFEFENEKIISIPQNIEIIWEDYYDTYLINNTELNFEKLDVYIGQRTILIRQELNENEYAILVCDSDNMEKFNIDFNIEVKGVIILNKNNLRNILDKIFLGGYKKFLGDYGIKDIKDIQEIKDKIEGIVIARYKKYEINHEFIKAQKEQLQNILLNENNNNVNNNENNNNDLNIEKKDEVVYENILDYYWNFVPEFYLKEVKNKFSEEPKKEKKVEKKLILSDEKDNKDFKDNINKNDFNLNKNKEVKNISEMNIIVNNNNLMPNNPEKNILRCNQRNQNNMFNNNNNQRNNIINANQNFNNNNTNNMNIYNSNNNMNQNYNMNII